MAAAVGMDVFYLVLFGQGGADAHHQTALNLAQECLRVQCPAALAGSHNAENGHFAGLFIHGDLCCLDSIAKGKVHITSVP
jgi:hypothetical protein